MARHRRKRLPRSNGNGSPFCEECGDRLDGQGICLRCQLLGLTADLLPGQIEDLVVKAGSLQAAVFQLAFQQARATGGAV